MASREAILLTATIAPPPGILSLGLTSPQTRLLQYLCSLLSWIRSTGARSIVFCENSAFPFDYSEIMRIARERGKDLEIVSFKADPSRWKRSKGWGEGEIMETAFLKSRILADTDVFYKASGRLFFPDFDAVADRYRGEPRAFRKHFMPGMTETMFFKCDKEFFLRHLVRAYEKVDDLIPYFIEHAYHDALLGLPFAELDFGRTIGRSATTGMVYDGVFSGPLIEEAARIMERGLHPCCNQASA